MSSSLRKLLAVWSCPEILVLYVMMSKVGGKVEKQMMIIKIVYFSPLRQNIIQYKYK